MSAAPMTEFALNLMQATGREGENVLISPMSVYSATAMVAGGAAGQTLTEMEDVLGMNLPELNQSFGAYLKSLQGQRLKLANGIWFSDDANLTVQQSFLQNCLDYYSADAYQITMDEQGKEKINHWVEENTDGMIPSILDQLPEQTLLVLVNALAFEDDWAEPYKEYQVGLKEFYALDKTYWVDAMYSQEGTYLEDAHATGFLKYFRNQRFAFAAVLPEEGMTPDGYLAQLDGAGLESLLRSATQQKVDTVMPVFETEFQLELRDALEAMGMICAFESTQADFSNMAISEDGPVYVDKVLHKTFMQVGPQGAKAGAATAYEMAAGCAMPPEEVKAVVLDRPFVYMLVDCDTMTPVLIGTMYEPCMKAMEEPEELVDEKPVIYLYPGETCQVDVKLQYDGELTHTYPAYENGWSVLAHPDGTLIDPNTGREYYCLFWEGASSAEYDFTKGFAVRGEDTAAFLEDALEKLGLNQREANEFLIYWLPRMEKNPYNLISFQQEAYTQSAQLQIEPAPDTLIRVFMAWKPLDTYVEIQPQTLTAPERTGFTVVEWGGTEVS